MNHIKIIFYRVILALSLGLFASCAAEVVATEPGPDVYVAPGAAPFIGAVWIGGEYRWAGHRYVLQGGHWAHPRSGRTWVGGNWHQARGGYSWNRGHWK